MHYRNSEDQVFDGAVKSVASLSTNPLNAFVFIMIGFVVSGIVSWNFGLDCYVRINGEVEEVTVINQMSTRSLSVRASTFEFFGADRNDNLHLMYSFSPWVGCSPGQAAAYTSWRQFEGINYGTMRIRYLADRPGTFVAEEDLGRFALQPLVLLLALVATIKGAAGFLNG